MLLSVSATAVFVVLALTSRGVLTSSASRYDLRDRYQHQQPHDGDTLMQYGQGKLIKNATRNYNVHRTSRGLVCY